MAKLTKRTVDTARPEEREFFLWDDDLPGFGLRVFPSGKRSYVVQYKLGGRHGRTRRISLGLHGKLTPDEARKKAAKLLGAVADGGDPAVERTEAKKALAIADLAALYLNEGPAEKPNKKASSWGADRSNIERHVKPLIGNKLIKTLTQADIARFQAEVAAGKSKADIKTKKRGRAIVEGGRGTAARSLAVLGAMLEFAVRRKLLPANPAKGVRLLKGERKERFLSEAEMARLGDTLAAMEAEKSISATAAAAVRLLLLTGCRKSEILTLRWGWIDFERGCLRLPDSKTGAKVVPLAAAALEMLNELPRDPKSDFVLPAAKGDGHHVGLQKAWERVRVRANLPDVRLHDLRHSFASFAVADGNTLFMVGKVLGHKQARTTEVYAHLADDPVRAVADRTAARIAAAMKGNAASKDNVVPLRPNGA
ncbi:MAG TPA: tyrosine-type recombinase/integrase [Stellaceae bacterium]|nr:tyrosine-type recombinase/integrase [Stellaceae bacterium]